MRGRQREWIGSFLLIGVLVMLPALPMMTSAHSSEPFQPTRPVAGPGGSETLFGRVSHRRIGSIPEGGWLFLPSDEAGGVSSSEPLPLVLFFHGYTALNPGSYLSWINHLALNGAAVFYPDYQYQNFTIQNPDNYLPQALRGVQALMEHMGSGDMPAIDLERVTAVGHSLGGVLAVNYAAIAEKEGAPIPTVLMPVEPGGCGGCGDAGDQLGAPLLDLGAIPESARALVVTGEADTVVEDLAAKVIWSGLDHVPLDQRDYIIFPSDQHGDPPLIADHLMPQTAGALGEVDALDFLGLWKLLDSLMACTFDGKWCNIALGDTESQCSLGIWSDGVPVKPLLVTDNPS